MTPHPPLRALLPHKGNGASGGIHMAEDKPEGIRWHKGTVEAVRPLHKQHATGGEVLIPAHAERLIRGLPPQLRVMPDVLIKIL